MAPPSGAAADGGPVVSTSSTSSQWWFTELPTQADQRLTQNDAVDCVGDTCWIVGWQEEFLQDEPGVRYDPMLTVLDGRKATVTPIPAAATDSLWPRDISCPRAGWCMSVGEVFDASRQRGVRTWAASYANGRWTTLPTPSPVEAGDSRAWLRGVSCTSPTSCAAVGFYYDGVNFEPRALVLRWNGTRWHRVLDPRVGIGMFTAIDCPVRDQCVVAGRTSNTSEARIFIRHWTPRGWRSVARPAGLAGESDATVRSVACIDIRSCLVGGEGMRVETPQGAVFTMLRTDGRISRALTFPAPVDESPAVEIIGISRTSDGGFAAAGSAVLSPEVGADRLFVQVTASDQVSIQVPFPDIAMGDGGPLMDVSCDGPCVAIGHYVLRTFGSGVPYALVQR